MSDRVGDFNKFMDDKAKQLVNDHMDAVHNANEVNADPNSTEGDANHVDQETGRHDHELHRDTSEEAQKEFDQLVQEHGGEPFIERQVEQEIKKVAEDINEGNELLKWAAGNVKVLAGILAAAAVGLFAGLHAYHFDGFDHPLVSTPALAKIEIANRQFESLVESSKILQQEVQLGLMLSRPAYDKTFLNLRDLANPQFVPPPPQISMPPRMAQLPVHVTLQTETERTEYTRPYQDVIASYDVPSESRRQIHSEVEKAVNAVQGTHTETYLTIEKVPKEAGFKDKDGHPYYKMEYDVVQKKREVPNH